MPSEPPDYLAPYRDAVRRFGPTFRSLLWQSEATQRVRFEALTHLVDLHAALICDAGCGRADLLPYLLQRSIVPEHYVGLEAVAELAEVARSRQLSEAVIVTADFVADPVRLAVGADVIYFGGSLNTVDEQAFRAVLKHASLAAAKTVALSFLCSPARAGEKHLRWRSPAAVAAVARSLGTNVRWTDRYLDGDCTLAFDVHGFDDTHLAAEAPTR